MNESIFVDNLSFHLDVALSHSVSCLSSFLSFQPFRMLCEINDCYMDVFLVLIQLKRENLKNVFGVIEFGRLNGLDTSLTCPL